MSVNSRTSDQVIEAFDGQSGIFVILSVGGYLSNIMNAGPIWLGGCASFR